MPDERLSNRRVNELANGTAAFRANVFESEQMALELQQLRAQNAALRKALRDLMGLVDSGVLVRDISKDAESGWSLKVLDLVQKLQAAEAALKLGGE